MVTDKVKHILISATISLLVGVSLIMFIKGFPLFWASFVCGMSAGCGKEYADSVYYKWDWYDMLANFIGSITGSSIITVVGIFV